MAYLLEPVAENAYALALWDDSWNSFNNCYLFVAKQDVVLVDAGKPEQSESVAQALAELGRTPADVKLLVATHGHLDHRGHPDFFPNAARWLHPLEWARLKPELQAAFRPSLVEGCCLPDFDCLLLGHHTPGSVALFHRPTRTLFIGDHVCFFGKLPGPDPLVAEHERMRQWAREWVREWASNEKDRQEYPIEPFLSGLERMLSWEPEFLCTGHGPVLRGGISGFLSELIDQARTALAGPPC